MAAKSAREQLLDAFFNFDTDKDGYISVEDLVVHMMTKGAKMSREEATQFAQEVDFDHDGHVYYQEAADYLLQDS
jgi:Ca2+-binding EF-hand superfamily protein